MTDVGEAAKLLALSCAYDSRKPDQARILAWADALADLNADDCAAAIREHYKHSTDFVMPAHIRQGVGRIIDRRRARDRIENPLRQQIEAAPKVDPRKVRAFIEEFAARRAIPEEGAA